MKGNKVFLIIISILIIGLCIFKLFFMNNQLENNKSIYCVMKDDSNNNKMEISYDFKDGDVYKFSIINTNKMNDNVNESNYKEFMEKSNKNYKGVTSKFWTDNNIYITTEYFELNLLTDDEVKELLGMSKTKLKKMTRKEIIDSMIPMGENMSFKCS